MIQVRGETNSLGADAREEQRSEEAPSTLAGLLARSGLDHDPEEFKRVASARKLYHWNSEHDQEY